MNKKPEILRELEDIEDWLTGVSKAIEESQEALTNDQVERLNDLLVSASYGLRRVKFQLHFAKNQAMIDQGVLSKFEEYSKNLEKELRGRELEGRC